MKVHVLEVDLSAQVYNPGWYRNTVTGQQYYYNGQTWYLYSNGLYYPQAVTWKASPSAMHTLAPGDKLRFNLSFKYIGPAVTKKFYAAVGNNSKSGMFSEWSGYTVRSSLNVPACSVVTSFTHTTDITIPDPSTFGHSGEDGGAYCKIEDGITLTEGVNCTPYYYDVCHIVAAAGDVSEFKVTSYVKV